MKIIPPSLFTTDAVKKDDLSAALVNLKTLKIDADEDIYDFETVFSMAIGLEGANKFFILFIHFHQSLCFGFFKFQWVCFLLNF